MVETDESCVAEGVQDASITGAAGAFFAAARASWDPSQFGAHVWRSVARNAGFFGVHMALLGDRCAMGGLFGISSCTFHQTTHTERYWGNVFGGFVAGLAIGIRTKSFNTMLGTATALAAANLAIGLSSGTLRGPIAQMSPDDRNKWNIDMFWRKPEFAPSSRALQTLDKSGQNHD